MSNTPAPITVYSRPACVQCDATYRKLDRVGAVPDVDYRVIDLSVDAEALEMIRGLGHLQAPVVVVTTPDGGEHWSGFKPDRIDTAVKRLRQVADAAA